MVAALKIQLRLPRLGRGSRRRGLYRFFLAADVLYLHVGRAEFKEHRLDDVPVRAGENLPENRAGNLDIESVALGPVQPGGLEPGGEGVNAYPGFDVL